MILPTVVWHTAATTILPIPVQIIVIAKTAMLVLLMAILPIVKSSSAFTTGTPDILTQSIAMPANVLILTAAATSILPTILICSFKRVMRRVTITLPTVISEIDAYVPMMFFLIINVSSTCSAAASVASNICHFSIFMSTRNIIPSCVTILLTTAASHLSTSSFSTVVSALSSGAILPANRMSVLCHLTLNIPGEPSRSFGVVVVPIFIAVAAILLLICAILENRMDECLKGGNDCYNGSGRRRRH
ncbi:hypothetical protein BGZ95_009225 [Linnemannia exigua]|uniref:Uncharacterized protein n=1 Tax=Linnemannia exigua TaxID=604196 RepID=A0AAD4DKV8_9FUNG|nr:hypothetical protein BGZ95_009225 [Linnemannia exigua]